MLLAILLKQSAPVNPKVSADDTRKDAELMARCCAGDEAALGELLDRHWKHLVRYAHVFLGDLDSAEDIVQDSFVRLWQNRFGWNGSGTVRGYVYRIVRNLALQENEKREVRLRFQKADHMHEPCATPAEELDRKRFRMAVQAAVDKLSPRRREILVLARFHDLSYNQIAEIMGISPQTVANQMSSALKELRTALKFPSD